jgi:hypothetical protein
VLGRVRSVGRGKCTYDQDLVYRQIHRANGTLSSITPRSPPSSSSCLLALFTDRFLLAQGRRAPELSTRQGPRAAVEEAPVVPNQPAGTRRQNSQGTKQVPVCRHRKGHRHHHRIEPSTLALGVKDLGKQHNDNLHQTVCFRQPHEQPVQPLGKDAKGPKTSGR